MQRHFKIIDGVGNGSYVYYWKSKGLSNEKVNSIETSDYGLIPYFGYYDSNKIRVKFNEGCLKQDRPTLLHGGIVNVYIVYGITDNFNVSSYPTLENCFFDEYGYSNFGIGFDRHGFFHTLLEKMGET